MECTGKLKGVAKDWVSGKWNLTFEVDGDIIAGIDQIKDKFLTVIAKQYRKNGALTRTACTGNSLVSLRKY